jgi:polyisoprenoid-binding protein YceI
MRRFLTAAWMIVTVLLAGATNAVAADYTIDLTHSHILFMVDHLGFAKMVGLFTNFGGKFSFDPENIPGSKLIVTIKTDSLQTQFAARDKDLKGADWFDVAEFPEMIFVGTEFVRKDEHTGTIIGKLTLHGATKPVTLDVTLNKVGQNPFDKQNSVGFSARGSFKRSDFGIKAFLGLIGDDVDFIIEIEAKQKS